MLITWCYGVKKYLYHHLRSQRIGGLRLEQSHFNGYVDFSGRSSRSEVWWWILFSIIANLVAAILDNGIQEASGLFAIIITLGLLLPNIAIQVRRMHDLDKSGWWLLILLIPLIGIIFALVWFCSKGTEGDNRFGSDPLS